MLRVALSIAVVSPLAVLGASCVALHDLDGYIGATESLCETLRQCFGDDYYPTCLAVADERLAGASPAEREAWLTALEQADCDATCEAARGCLDEPPVCGSLSQACGQQEQCCGFTVGTGSCQSGGCCKPDGIACESGAECCEGSCSPAAGMSGTYCGGYACLEAGATCTEHFDCCTEICIDGRCSDTTCLPAGSDCTLNAQCCAGECSLAELATGAEASGTCVEPRCRKDGTPCETAATCCGSFCVTSMGGISVCSQNQCLPANVACEPGANECCGTCDAVTKRCVALCGGPDDPCTKDGDCCDGNCNEDAGTCGCYADGSFCEEHAECCDGNCANSVCGAVVCPPAGSACDPNDDPCCDGCELDARDATLGTTCCAPNGCSHTVCVKGGPLSEVCPCPECGSDGANGDADQCIAGICAELPHCCCFEWDRECVDLAKSRCKADCANGDVAIEPPEGTLPAP